MLRRGSLRDGLRRRAALPGGVAPRAPSDCRAAALHHREEGCLFARNGGGCRSPLLQNCLRHSVSERFHQSRAASRKRSVSSVSGVDGFRERSRQGGSLIVGEHGADSMRVQAIDASELRWQLDPVLLAKLEICGEISYRGFARVWQRDTVEVQYELQPEVHEQTVLMGVHGVVIRLLRLGAGELGLTPRPRLALAGGALGGLRRFRYRDGVMSGRLCSPRKWGAGRAHCPSFVGLFF